MFVCYKKLLWIFFAYNISFYTIFNSRILLKSLLIIAFDTCFCFVLLLFFVFGCNLILIFSIHPLIILISNVCICLRNAMDLLLLLHLSLFVFLYSCHWQRKLCMYEWSFTKALTAFHQFNGLSVLFIFLLFQLSKKLNVQVVNQRNEVREVCRFLFVCFYFFFSFKVIYLIFAVRTEMSLFFALSSFKIIHD